MTDDELGIAVGGGLIMLVVLSFLFIGHKRRRRMEKSAPPTSLETARHSPGSAGDDHELYVLEETSFFSPPVSFDLRSPSFEQEADHQPEEAYETWKHPDVLAVRVSISDISLDELVARGTNSEVYRGHYRSQVVAIKKPLPQWLSERSNVDAFFTRAKLLASPALTHPGIVSFLGVAWRSLAYVCMVSEFMAGGDLRSLLSRRQHQPGARRDALGRRGFCRQKVYLASQIASALSFLHAQGLVHGAVRSRNVLLDENLNAKLSGFEGSVLQPLITEPSRPSHDAAISPAPPKLFTTSVATGVTDRLQRARSQQDALWNAPEVLCGERTNSHTDVFSFGVVLSELDSLTTPYGHTSRLVDPKESDELLEKIAAGHVQVRFTSGSRSRHGRRGSSPLDANARTTMAVVRLGKSCVALDPLARPSAAMVSAELHKILQALGPQA